MKDLYRCFVECEVVTDEYIDERISSFFEEMTVGNLGFTGSASPEGPVSGFDPVMNVTSKKQKTRKKSGRINGRNQ